MQDLLGLKRSTFFYQKERDREAKREALVQMVLEDKANRSTIQCCENDVMLEWRLQRHTESDKRRENNSSSVVGDEV